MKKRKRTLYRAKYTVQNIWQSCKILKQTRPEEKTFIRGFV